MIVDGITYRNCESKDITAVLSMWLEADALPGPTDDEESLKLRLQRDAELFLLAFDDDRLVGSVMGGWDGWRANFYRLAVAPSHRRKGIATTLVREVEKRMRDAGAVRAHALAVKPELEPAAIPFWETMGYEVNPRLEPYLRSLK